MSEGVEGEGTRGSWAFAVAGAGLLAVFAYLRFATFHNRTFDLAFYTRMAWGMASFDHWDPILEAHVFGLHVAPVLYPIGWLGRVFGTAPVLIVVQSAAFGAAALALGRMGMRRLGPAGAWAGVAALLLHPNVAHAGTFEAHPGTLAVAPLAWALERLDAGDGRAVIFGCLGVLACREDLALVTFMVGVLAALRPEHRRMGVALAVGSLLYLGLFLFVLHPAFAPESGSLQAHFGKWGDSFGDVLMAWIRSPLEVARHLAAPARLRYLLLLLAPLLALPLLRPRWCLPALPILGVNLMSEFPTSIHVSEHYTTPALPMLVAGAIHGLGALPEGARRMAFGMLAMALGSAFVLGGPWSLRADYRPDERSRASAHVLDAIDRADPAGTRSVQAPHALLAHVAERRRVFRAPPPDRNADLVVLDLRHRARWRHRETLLRTDEEPTARAWLARDEYGARLWAPPWLLLERNADPRGGAAARYFLPDAPDRASLRLSDCLRLEGAERAGDAVRLVLRATGPCPADLALRIEHAHPGRERRVDLPFDGVLSPAHLRAGDRLASHHMLTSATDAVYVGALRSSGARPSPEDPPWIRVPLGE